jgi:hypothetical protein
MSKDRRDQRGSGPIGSVASDETTETDDERAARRYAEDLVARGEAVEEGAPLTNGATHEIVHSAPGKPPTVRRRRYSAF